MPTDKSQGLLPCIVDGRIVYTIEEFRAAQEALKRKKVRQEPSQRARGADSDDDLSPEVQAQVARMMAGKE